MHIFLVILLQENLDDGGDGHGHGHGHGDVEHQQLDGHGDVEHQQLDQVQLSDEPHNELQDSTCAKDVELQNRKRRSDNEMGNMNDGNDAKKQCQSISSLQVLLDKEEAKIEKYKHKKNALKAKLTASKTELLESQAQNKQLRDLLIASKTEVVKSQTQNKELAESLAFEKQKKSEIIDLLKQEQAKNKNLEELLSKKDTELNEQKNQAMSELQTKTGNWNNLIKSQKIDLEKKIAEQKTFDEKYKNLIQLLSNTEKNLAETKKALSESYQKNENLNKHLKDSMIKIQQLEKVCTNTAFHTVPPVTTLTKVQQTIQIARSKPQEESFFVKPYIVTRNDLELMLQANSNISIPGSFVGACLMMMGLRYAVENENKKVGVVPPLKSEEIISNLLQTNNQKEKTQIIRDFKTDLMYKWGMEGNEYTLIPMSTNGHWTLIIISRDIVAGAKKPQFMAYIVDNAYNNVSNAVLLCRQLKLLFRDPRSTSRQGDNGNERPTQVTPFESFKWNMYNIDKPQQNDNSAIHMLEACRRFLFKTDEVRFETEELEWARQYYYASCVDGILHVLKYSNLNVTLDSTNMDSERDSNVSSQDDDQEEGEEGDGGGSGTDSVSVIQLE